MAVTWVLLVPMSCACRIPLALLIAGDSSIRKTCFAKASKYLKQYSSKG